MTAGSLQTVLDQVTQTAVKHTLEKWSAEKLAQCFPTLARSQPEVLNNAHQQVADFVKTTIETRYQALCEEYKTAEKFQQLAEMVQAVSPKKYKFDPATEPNPTSDTPFEVDSSLLNLETLLLPDATEEELQERENELQALKREQADLIASLSASNSQADALENELKHLSQLLQETTVILTQ